MSLDLRKEYAARGLDYDQLHNRGPEEDLKKLEAMKAKNTPGMTEEEFNARLRNPNKALLKVLKSVREDENEK